MSSDSLHPRIREVIAALHEAQQETDALCAALTAQDASRRLGDGWSVAEVVEHMAIVEDGAGRVVGTLAKQVAGVPETSNAPVASSLDHFRATDPSFHKLVAPEMVEPKSGAAIAESLERMRASRARLVAALEKASGTALGTAHFPHPRFGPLDGYQWALLAAQHQLRHLVQIRNILAS